MGWKHWDTVCKELFQRSFAVNGAENWGVGWIEVGKRMKGGWWRPTNKEKLILKLRESLVRGATLTLSFLDRTQGTHDKRAFGDSRDFCSIVIDGVTRVLSVSPATSTGWGWEQAPKKWWLCFVTNSCPGLSWGVTSSWGRLWLPFDASSGSHTSSFLPTWYLENICGMNHIWHMEQIFKYLTPLWDKIIFIIQISYFQIIMKWNEK